VKHQGNPYAQISSLTHLAARKIVKFLPLSLTPASHFRLISRPIGVFYSETNKGKQ